MTTKLHKFKKFGKFIMFARYRNVLGRIQGTVSTSILALLLAFGPLTGVVTAASSITGITVNSSSAVTVAPSSSVSVTVAVQITDNNDKDWKGTKYQIGSGTEICVDTQNLSKPANNSSPASTGTATFTVTAPSTTATSNVTIKIYDRDNCSGSVDATSTLTNAITTAVADTTAPVIATPSNITAEATSAAGAVVTYTAPNATDNVDATAAALCSPVSGTIFTLGQTTVSCNKTDAAGNIAVPKNFTVTVSDTIAPIIAPSSNITAEATSAAGAVVTYTVPTTTDAVDGTTNAVCSPASGTTFTLGQTTVSCNKEDAAGNDAAQSQFIVTVSDTTKPILAPVSNITQEATSAAGAVVNYAAPTVSDAVSTALSAICSPVSGGIFAITTTTVSCNATDAAGNSNTSSFNIIVRDITPAVIATMDDITVEAEDADGALVEFDSPATLDIVDGTGVAICASDDLLVSGDVFPLGTTTVYCNATDARGNAAAETSFDIIVEDTTAPSIDPVLSFNVEAEDANGATVTYGTPLAFDLVDGMVAVFCTPTSGTVLAIGEHDITCESEDVAGNVSDQTFTITVKDTTAPVINVVSTIVVAATSTAGAIVTYATPTTSDAVDGIEAADCLPASGSLFAVGTTSVTCSMTDVSGNVSIPRVFSIIVNQFVAPVATTTTTPTETPTAPTGTVLAQSTTNTPSGATNTPAPQVAAATDEIKTSSVAKDAPKQVAATSGNWITQNWLWILILLAAIYTAWRFIAPRFVK